MLQDLRYALRQLRKNPGFAITSVLTLALAIGVATAAFSVLYAVLLRPLPYHQPEQIISLQTYSPQGYSQPASYPEFAAWRDGNQSFTALAGVQSYYSINLEGPSGAVALNKVESSDNFFTVFGVSPVLGRTFLPGEDQPGKNDVAVLSHEVWQEEFGGRTDVIGQTAKLDGRPYVVIGVMPAGFRYPLSSRKAVYVPFHLPTALLTASGSHWMFTVARLKPGVSLIQAQADVNRMMSGLINANRVPAGRRMKLRELSSDVTGDLVAPFRVLMLSVLAVLAIGCANIAGLLLARGVKREHEIGVRISIGASKWRVMRQLLSETLVLGAAGAIGGLCIAVALLHSTRALLIGAFARGVDVQIDKPALLAALGLTLLATLLSGLLPAWRISGIEPNRVLKASRGTGSSRSQQRLRSAFVIVQVAAAFCLLITSGLLLRSLSESLHTNFGISTDHLLTVDVLPSRAGYEKRDIIATLYNPLIEKVRAIPGVREAGLISILPIRNWGTNAEIQIAGHPPFARDQQHSAEIRFVTPGYFNTLGLSLTRGRMLDENIDRYDSSLTGVLVNDAFAKSFFAEGEDPVGRQIEGFGLTRNSRTVIVGVVGSVRQDLHQQPLPEIDFLISQFPPDARLDDLQSLSMVVRTSVEPASIVPSLRRAFNKVDSGLPLGIPKTMPEVISDTLLYDRFQNWIFATFATLALVLAIVGLYGLVSQEVELSTRDIGVKMAMGATPGRTLADIYRRVALLLSGGLVIGLLAVLLLKRLLAAVVVVAPGKDFGVIIGLAAVLFGAGLLAALLPARRAASIDPIVALRYE